MYPTYYLSSKDWWTQSLSQIQMVWKRVVLEPEADNVYLLGSSLRYVDNRSFSSEWLATVKLNMNHDYHVSSVGSQTVILIHWSFWVIIGLIISSFIDNSVSQLCFLLYFFVILFTLSISLLITYIAWWITLYIPVLSHMFSRVTNDHY